MPTRAIRILYLLFVTLAALPLTGCGASSDARSFEIAPGDYARALTAPRETLRAAGYAVERVDAIAGEITTGEKIVAGVATPLASENNALRGVLADTLSNRPRTVRVRFRDASDPGAPPREDGAVRAEVDAIIWRTLYPNWRTETETVLGNFVWRDPLLAERGVTGATPVPLKRDDRFAREIAGRIAWRLSAE